MENLHCKHVFFCASADKGYASLLRPFVGDVAQRITLVEATPFPHDLAEVASNFQVTRWTQIFRGSKLSPRSFNSGPATGLGDRLPPATYTSTVSRETSGPANVQVAVAAPIPSNTQTDKLPLLATKIPVNRNDQRVDPKLPQYKKDRFVALQALKLCNRHYLSYCSGCRYKHDVEVKESELDTLRCIARQSACKNGVDCRDIYCVASHMCTYGDKCCQPDECRYPKAMHIRDTQVARYVEPWSA